MEKRHLKAYMIWTLLAVKHLWGTKYMNINSNIFARQQLSLFCSTHIYHHTTIAGHGL